MDTIVTHVADEALRRMRDMGYNMRPSDRITKQVVQYYYNPNNSHGRYSPITYDGFGRPISQDAPTMFDDSVRRLVGEMCTAKRDEHISKSFSAQTTRERNGTRPIPNVYIKPVVQRTGIWIQT
jgi:hypothetical protein